MRWVMGWRLAAGAACASALGAGWWATRGAATGEAGNPGALERDARAMRAQRASAPDASPSSLVADQGDDAARGAQTDAQVSGDAEVPLVFMQPEELAAPWDHFGRVARYDGFRDAAQIGESAALVGCKRLRVLGASGAAPRDVPLPTTRTASGVKGKEGAGRGCVRVLGHDDVRLFYAAGAEVYAFDVAGGQLAWAVDLLPDASGNREVPSQGAVVGPVLAVPTSGGNVVAFTRETGAVAWQVSPPEGTAGLGAGASQVQIAASGDHLIASRRVDAPEWNEKQRRWQARLTPPMQRPGKDWTDPDSIIPATYRELTKADVLVALEAATGAVAWTVTVGAGATGRTGGATDRRVDAASAAAFAGPIAADGSTVAYLASPLTEERLTMVLLDARTGATTAEVPLGGNITDAVRVDLVGGSVYFGHDQLQRFDAATGARSWGSYPAAGLEGADGQLAPLATREAVFVVTPSAVLEALDPKNGAPVWSFGFAGLRVAHDGSRSGPLTSPRLLVDPSHPGEPMVAAVAWTSDDASGAAGAQLGEVSLFARVTERIERRTARAEGELRGDDVTTTPSSYEVLGRLLPATPEGHRLRVDLRGNGQVALQAGGIGAGETIPDVVIDLERKKPSYQVVFHSVDVAQGCQ